MAHSVLPQATTALARRRSRDQERQTAHLAALARHGLTPDTCPVCLICPEIPDPPRTR